MKVRVSGWALVCGRCGREWVLEVSFNLQGVRRLYHFCPYCRTNTFHEVRAAKLVQD